jgi:hypothetical protein
MRKAPRVTLLKQIKSNDKWIPAAALFDSKGRVRRDHVRVAGGIESIPKVVTSLNGGRKANASRKR